MASPNLQLEGGNFQNGSGAVIAGGTLLFQLSHDEEYAIGPSQIVGGQKFTATLNNSGSIPASPAFMVYDNSVLLPSGSYYIVRLFDSTGAEVWASPQYWVLTSSPNPLDVGTIVPTNPPGSGLSGGGSTLLLETNGTVNTNQALLNLANGSNVTITNSAGTTTISAVGAITVTTGGFLGPGFPILYPYFGGLVTATGFLGNAANQVNVWQFDLLYGITISTVSTVVGTNVGGATVNFGLYNSAKNKVLDSGAMSAAALGVVVSNITPVALSAGTYYFAQSSSNTGVQVSTATVSSTYVGTGVTLLNTKNVKTGQSPNATVAGVLPASLGTLSADVVYANVGIPLFEI